LIIITLPIYKDNVYLARACTALEELAPAICTEFKLLIAEDGSDSSEIVTELRQKFSNIIYVRHEDRLGRGRALREAWRKMEADVYVYLDVDLATDLRRFGAFEKLIIMQKQFDLVTGSRYIKGSITTRPRLRRWASVAYNALVRGMFGTGVHDHQCGFKSFSRKLVDMLASEATSDSWFWDTEAIILAKKFDFKIAEIPVYWTEQKGAKTPLRRLVNDVWLHGSGLVRLFWRISRDM
jgi:glycosyltransferase involved in cell wall biosynthesis